ncbi:RNA methyltransferase [Prevotella scopos JCM 17725]|uniref:RNA methyltransferase, TrmH family n=1 Tax=Prevotella scopos JCM 17725 TaxID=1236518 RepID=A0AAX2F6Q6_9BACT|nr:RNA methyltransferase [Prevotella scopos]ANR74068.1 RNA methyltransferase [Prevotella scopos JCM 17725]QUB44658.1 RNA methyltransferase [Prevotella scopos JCM 17725]SHG11190.1 RNA methyltransferase, TrmH family [Prevotella scopos JCM 17725]
MISKNKIKLIRSLETKKGREKVGLFVAEGPKVVNDLLHEGFVAEDILDNIEDINKVSFLQHPQSLLGVFKLPEVASNTMNDYLILFKEGIENQLVLALDGVQDPGNLGTIIRIADWFGIEDIFCSHETADCWNPKVVQATMGSIARVKLHYLNLYEMIDQLPTDYPIYATLLDGNNIYAQELSRHGMIVMGNEGKGISPQLRTKINRKLFIPNYPPERETAESLNVAIATSIVCAEFRRR